MLDYDTKRIKIMDLIFSGEVEIFEDGDLKDEDDEVTTGVQIKMYGVHTK